MSDFDHRNEENEQDESHNDIRRHSRRMGDAEQVSMGSSAWLVSFTDVMALMLTFFVLLFAMSKPEAKSWSEISSALQNEFNKFYGPMLNRGMQDSVNLDKVNFNQALNLNYLHALIESVIKDNPSLSQLEIITQPDHLILSMPQDLLFDPSDISVNENGMRVIYALGGALARIKNSVEIIGHADPRPLQTEEGQYTDNWSLSMARAASVAGLLKSVGYNKEVVVRGLSSGRYEDLKGVLSSDEARLNLSRRVDIIIRDHDGTKRKVFFTLEFP
jgi:chemotaxis protein MotB